MLHVYCRILVVLSLALSLALSLSRWLQRLAFLLLFDAHSMLSSQCLLLSRFWKWCFIFFSILVQFVCILQHVLFGLLRCHLFALLTYFVCLRNCFPAAKQQCSNSLQCRSPPSPPATASCSVVLCMDLELQIPYCLLMEKSRCSRIALTAIHSSLQLDYWFWSSVKRHPVQQILCISVCWLIGIQIGNIHVVQCGRRYFVGFTPKNMLHSKCLFTNNANAIFLELNWPNWNFRYRILPLAHVYPNALYYPPNLYKTEQQLSLFGVYVAKVVFVADDGKCIHDMRCTTQ